MRMSVRVSMKRKYWVLLTVLFWILLSDQWTKHIVQQRLFLHRTVEVIPGFFNLVHVRNRGGAFGIFGGQGDGFSSFLFVAVSLIAIGTILFLFARLKEEETSLSLSFSLVLGGALGNLIDRLHYGAVIDFLDFHLLAHHWPAFNIADSAICVGIGLMALELFIRDNRRKTPNSSRRITNKPG